MNITEAREHIVKTYKKYWILNDEGHRVKHFKTVEMCALEIKKRLGLEISNYEIMLSAYLHDLFSGESRDFHNVLAYEFVMTTDDPTIEVLSTRGRERVAVACLQNRSSFKGPYHSELAELVAAADSEFPAETEEALLERSIQYNMHHHGLNEEDGRKAAIEYVIRNKGSKTRPMYDRAFKKEIQLRSELIEKLTNKYQRS